MHWAEVGVFDANAAALGIDAADLMAAAGAALAGQAIHMIRAAADGLLPDRPVWILCGPGNNGGDGFACALGLIDEGLDVLLQCSHAVQKGETAQMFRDRCREAGLVEESWPLTLAGRKPCLVIDCLLGAGVSSGSDSGGGSAATRPLRGAVAQVVGWIGDSAPRAPVLACDGPTGLGTEDVLVADATVTFHAEKMGLRLNGSPAPGVGNLHIASLPWPEQVADCGPGDALRYPALDADARKGDRGRVMVVGGGPYHGAPLLAGVAAARVGCDLVHVAMPSDAAARAEWPASLIPESLPDADILTLGSVEVIEGRLRRGRGCQAMLIGPGLGRDEATVAAVRELLHRAVRLGIPTVVDADAVAALPEAAWPDGLIGVATPHSREAAGWLGDVSPAAALDGPLTVSAGVESDESSDAGREIAEVMGGLELDAGPEAGHAVDAGPESIAVVVTGPTDHLYGSGGRRAKATGGHPRMAVGGTGDLLAGIITGLLAQGMPAWPAARLGCALLRTAGAAAAVRYGPGLLAADVPPHIAETLAAWLPTAADATDE